MNPKNLTALERKAAFTHPPVAMNTSPAFVLIIQEQYTHRSVRGNAMLTLNKEQLHPIDAVISHALHSFQIVQTAPLKSR